MSGPRTPGAGVAHTPARQPRGRTGFTLVEAVIAIVLVGVLLTGALTAAGASARMRWSAADRDLAAGLAIDLVEEIAQKGYGSTTAGPIAETMASGSRAALSTIDAYNGLLEEPPVRADGKPIPAAANLMRLTAVERVSASDPSSTGTAETGVKRVTVTVYRGSTALYAAQFLRTSAWSGAKD